MMRMALAQALHHARHRTVFQKRLADQPMMRDACSPTWRSRSKAAIALVDAAVPLVRSCRERPQRGGAGAAAHAGGQILGLQDRARLRLRGDGVPRRQWLCRGDSLLPRLYREAPVNAIWEGSGNVMCLDVLRALAREGEAARAVLGDLRGLRGLAGRKRGVAFIQDAVGRGQRGAGARRGRTAGDARGRPPLPKAQPEVAEAFARTRLAGPTGRNLWNRGPFGCGSQRDLSGRALPAA